MHKSFPLRVIEQSTFSPNRLGNEKTLGITAEKYGRVKLDKFHITETAASPKTGGHAISSGNVGVGSVFI